MNRQQTLDCECANSSRKNKSLRSGGFIAAGVAALFWAMATFAQNVPTELIHYPDFVFFNGPVLTADADEDFTVAEAVAVRGNRIFAVGSSQEILRLAGPDTRRIDLRGRSLTPGFVYNDGDNAVPAGDILKESQWNGWIYPSIGGETIGQALATLAFLVEQEGEAGEPMFFNLNDSWASMAMKSWSLTTLDEIAPETPIIIYLDSSYGLVNAAYVRGHSAAKPGNRRRPPQPALEHRGRHLVRPATVRRLAGAAPTRRSHQIHVRVLQRRPPEHPSGAVCCRAAGTRPESLAIHRNEPSADHGAA